MTLLERLVKADQELFTADGENWAWTPGASYFPRPPLWESWPLAGWCLEQMQARWKELWDTTVLSDEREALYQALLCEHRKLDPLVLTPESIIDAYISWKEATGGVK